MDASRDETAKVKDSSPIAVEAQKILAIQVRPRWTTQKPCLWDNYDVEHEEIEPQSGDEEGGTMY